jgi:hypothetical protein
MVLSFLSRIQYRYMASLSPAILIDSWPDSSLLNTSLPSRLYIFTISPVSLSLPVKYNLSETGFGYPLISPGSIVFSMALLHSWLSELLFESCCAEIREKKNTTKIIVKSLLMLTFYQANCSLLRGIRGKVTAPISLKVLLQNKEGKVNSQCKSAALIKVLPSGSLPGLNPDFAVELSSKA